jgi:tetratricopeptide (TPR) repeat protein
MQNEQRQHNDELRHAYYRRLCVLELRAARQGNDTPPDILIEIEDLREKIAGIDKEIGFTEPLVDSTTHQQVEIIFKGNFIDLTPELRDATIRSIAGILAISPDQIVVLRAMSGSIIFHLQMPRESAEQLLALYETDDPIIDELGIEQIRTIDQKSDRPIAENSNQAGGVDGGAIDRLLLRLNATIGSLIRTILSIGSNKPPTPKNKINTNQSITIGGDVSGGNIVIGSKNIVVQITRGIDKKALDKDRSISYKEQGRAKVQEWGEQKKRYSEWNWHLLGQAMEYYIDAIKYDPQNQHAWTNLGYVYHLIGESQKAEECLSRSLSLASPGPNYPGNNYKQVRIAVDSESYLSGGRIEQDRPPMPEWFRTKYKYILD